MGGLRVQASMNVRLGGLDGRKESDQDEVFFDVCSEVRREVCVCMIAVT